MNWKKQITNMIGLAKKAGRLSGGGFLVEKDIKRGAAYLVITARDAGAASRKQLEDKANYRQVPVVEWGTKKELGAAIGQGERTCLAVLDEGFSRKIAQLIQEEPKTGEEEE